MGARVRAVDLVDHDDAAAGRARRALRSTKRVWGMGPSTASTSSSTPSTIVRSRSTSPPKSAWPGVSTMLILVSSVVDGGVLGQDGDAALALEVVRVHDALGDRWFVAERPRLAKHGVDEGRLAVVDVGDDGDVANVGGLESYRKSSIHKTPRAGFAARGAMY